MNRQFISYPKSGRSWIRYCLHRLGFEQAVAFHHDSFEFNSSDKPLFNLDFELRLSTYSKVDKVVYMHRDPRDIMVSLYHQVTGRFEDFFAYPGTLSDFIRDDYFGAKNLKLFQDQWQQLCHAKIAYPISYEECHEDFETVLAGLLNYYEFNVDSELLHQAIQAAQFDEMRKLEMSESFPEPWLRPRNGCLKTRVGKPFNFSKSLAPADLAYLNDVFCR